MISSSQRPLPDNTPHSQQTNIHAPRGIPTQNISRRAATGRSSTEIVGSNPTGAWIFVCCECRGLSDRGLCDELITCPEESYQQLRRCVWSRNIRNRCSIYIYIYDISNLRVNANVYVLRYKCWIVCNSLKTPWFGYLDCCLTKEIYNSDS
jgi:hypothetical protein